MRRKLVAGNWKLNGSVAENERLLKAILSSLDGFDGADCAVCVPFPYLRQVSELLSGSKISWGSQDVSPHAKGAFTGEVSVQMLKEFGCRYAIVGHSERRTLHGESDELVAAKAEAVLKGGLIPIVCVGETLAEREAGITNSIIERQIAAVIDRCGAAALAGAVVAYEPVWAIGTGKTASPQQAQDAHAAIRARIALADPKVAENIAILYGGSVKAQNATELFGRADIDGGLIGGAALVADDFVGIVRAAG